ncbi:hypothetical protein DA2_3891 [Desulfovibrio sp. A2]|nr:hypothetical protein DA2_3891 [Desulfovibrio sp. A2]
MKRITTFAFGLALLLTASFASAQTFGAGMMGAGLSGFQGTAQTSNTTQFTWPMFGFGTQTGGQTTTTAAQGATAQGNLAAFMPMLQLFGGSSSF